jgi:hypothetical protein
MTFARRPPWPLSLARTVVALPFNTTAGIVYVAILLAPRAEDRNVSIAFLCLFLVAWYWTISINHSRLVIRHAGDLISFCDKFRLPDYGKRYYKLEDYVPIRDASFFVPVMVVWIVPLRKTSPPVGAYMAYYYSWKSCVFFVPDPPELINPLQKFLIYHEAGHMATTGWLNTLQGIGTTLRTGVGFLPAFLLTNGFWPMVVIAVCALFRCTWEGNRILAECGADRFALQQFAKDGGYEMVESAVRPAALYLKREADNDQAGDHILSIRLNQMLGYKNQLCEDIVRVLAWTPPNVDPEGGKFLSIALWPIFIASAVGIVWSRPVSRETLVTMAIIAVVLAWSAVWFRTRAVRLSEAAERSLRER